MKIIVDRDVCAGLGVCESIAPDYFEVDGHGELVLRREHPADADIADVREAVASCPTSALRLGD